MEPERLFSLDLSCKHPEFDIALSHVPEYVKSRIVVISQHTRWAFTFPNLPLIESLGSICQVKPAVFVDMLGFTREWLPPYKIFAQLYKVDAQFPIPFQDPEDFIAGTERLPTDVVDLINITLKRHPPYEARAQLSIPFQNPEDLIADTERQPAVALAFYHDTGMYFPSPVLFVTFQKASRNVKHNTGRLTADNRFEMLIAL